MNIDILITQVDEHNEFNILAIAKSKILSMLLAN